MPAWYVTGGPEGRRGCSQPEDRASEGPARGLRELMLPSTELGQMLRLHKTGGLVSSLYAIATFSKTLSPLFFLTF